MDQGEWKEMEYVEVQDPSYVELVYEWELSEVLMPGKRSSDPEKAPTFGEEISLLILLLANMLLKSKQQICLVKRTLQIPLTELIK